ncbi:CYTH and CHAD domain-containing protein [Plastoroseomonas arctica]|uniref:CHAD domain-containing protein n=1 Tax=Plastoroseomonas arctica TaxID=1509237 RepID=A0AAF1KJU4_9PROT|nr:CHAD domain-containing protein [Plastoroseomonas arctica]MBR0655845.1 CHAD domain-containing protein [Plastoroseomonas arctica]
MPDQDVPTAEIIEIPPPPEPPAAASLTLEVALPPEDAARLSRLPAIAARRNGRSRGAAESLLWLDTPTGTLAAEGLALEQSPRGQRSLIRALPAPHGASHPGAAPETLPIETLPECAPEAPYISIAAFDGRRLSFTLDDPAGPVTAILRTGKLRAVAAEREIARLTLTGPPGAVVAMIQAIAAELPALPPLASLAEEARALAHGIPARPRRRGAPDLATAETVADALAQASGHLADAVLAMAPLVGADAGPEGVHQMRVGLRRLRSMLKLMRKAADGPAPRALEDGLKTLLAYLGPARDWDVFTRGLGAQVAEAMPGNRPIAQFLDAAEQRRQEAYVALEAFLAGPGYRAIAWELAAFPATLAWREGASADALALQATPLEAFGAHLLGRRWKGLARDAAGMEAMDGERLHEMRLDAKRLRYAAELFAPLFAPRRTRRFQKRLAALQEALGLANDATVASNLAQSLANGRAERSFAIGVVTGWAQAQAVRIRRDAEDTWTALDAAGPFW